MNEPQRNELVTFLRHYWPMFLYMGLFAWLENFIVKHQEKDDFLMISLLTLAGIAGFFVLGFLCAESSRAEEERIAARQKNEQRQARDDRGQINQAEQKTKAGSHRNPSHQQQLASSLTIKNFPSTISSIAMHLEQLFLSELLENNNVLPPCLLEDDYILGFCWAVSIKQAKQENLETFNLETDVKWEILILSLSRAIAVNPKVLEPKLRTAVRNKTDMFSSGYSDGSEYDWSSPSQAGDSFEDRKRALLES